MNGFTKEKPTFIKLPEADFIFLDKVRSFELPPKKIAGHGSQSDMCIDNLCNYYPDKLLGFCELTDLQKDKIPKSQKTFPPKSEMRDSYKTSNSFHVVRQSFGWLSILNNSLIQELKKK